MKTSLFLFFLWLSTPLLANEKPDLSGLKDVILGQKPSIFPLATGWWILITISFIVIICGIILCKRHFFPSPYFYTIKEIDSLKKRKLSTVQIAKELSKILKRVAILKFGREETANLSNAEWAKFLKEKSKKKVPEDIAELIAKATFLPPEKDVAISSKSLYTYAKNWVKTVLKGK